MFTSMMLGIGTRRNFQFDNRVTRNLDGNPVTWSYDDLYRLTSQAKAGHVCTYTLDGRVALTGGRLVPFVREPGGLSDGLGGRVGPLGRVLKLVLSPR